MPFVWLQLRFWFWKIAEWSKLLMHDGNFVWFESLSNSLSYHYFHDILAKFKKYTVQYASFDTFGAKNNSKISLTSSFRNLLWAILFQNWLISQLGSKIFSVWKMARVALVYKQGFAGLHSVRLTGCPNKISYLNSIGSTFFKVI